MNMKLSISVAVVLSLFIISGSCIRGGKMQSVTVSPSMAVVAEGTTRQFNATARFSDGSAIDWTTAADWSTSDPDSASAGVTFGFHGLVTAISSTANPIIITATDLANGITGTATLFITHYPLVALEITPVNKIISVGTITQFTAKGTFADGTVTDGVQSADGTTGGTPLPPLTSLVTWDSSNPEVATISNTEGSIGVATAVGPGVTTITAKDPATQVSDSTQLIVQ